jgi:hypothetical protein
MTRAGEASNCACSRVSSGPEWDELLILLGLESVGSQAALSCSATAERPDQAELETLSGSMRNRKSRAHARFSGYFSGKYQN